MAGEQALSASAFFGSKPFVFVVVNRRRFRWHLKLNREPFKHVDAKTRRPSEGLVVVDKTAGKAKWSPQR